MANPKGRLRTVGLIVLGFLMGSILGGGLIAWRYYQMFKQQYYTEILSIANTAYMIRADLQDELLKNIEGNIQQCIVSADSMWGNDEDRLNAFWYVQRYYERYKLVVPDNIKSILNKLPPDPRQEKFAASTRISIGDKAPNFTCTTLNGETISLSELQGKVVLVNFFATWCGPCVKEMPYLQSEVFETFRADDFFMIAIAREQQVKDVTEFKNTKGKGLTFPMAVDTDSSIYNLFATQFIPRIFVIDKEGIVKWESGGLSKPQFEDLVNLIRKELQ
jgi:peroxiredoxin